MFFVLSYVCYVFVRVCLYVLCGKGLTSWLSFVVSNCEFVTAGDWDCVAAVERLPALTIV